MVGRSEIRKVSETPKARRKNNLLETEDIRTLINGSNDHNSGVHK